MTGSHAVHSEILDAQSRFLRSGLLRHRSTDGFLYQKLNIVAAARAIVRGCLLAVLLIMVVMRSEAQVSDPYASRSSLGEEDSYRLQERYGKALVKNLPKLNKVISVDLRNVPLSKGLRKIAHLGGLQLTYAEEILAGQDRLTMELDGVTVLKALQEALDGTNLQLNISSSGHVIVVRRRPLVPAAKPQPVVGGPASGKIAGRVVDTDGNPLPGVNVVLEGTTTGATTDTDGYYAIINVPPGEYSVRASFIGFASQVVTGVRVNIDLTTTIDFTLGEDTIGLDEVVVAAERPIVQADVSANVANLNLEDFEHLPVAGVSEVLDLQAGIEPGLQIRGGGLGEIAFMLDGMNMRTGRDNQPIRNISYTSLEEVQVQTGGFSAEYGNVRAGVVNVATKEPSRTRYNFDGLFRIQPAQEKTFGALSQLPDHCDYTSSSISSDCDNWWVRPALDPTVNMEGTDNSNAWDRYQQRQYSDFEGWNSVVSRLRAAGFDVAEEDMIEYFKYTHRKNNTITRPDFAADFTFGGPVPGISRKLGDLRFLASYRGTQTAYLYPQTREAFRDNTWQLKVLSNVKTGMRLAVNGLIEKQRGQNSSCCTAQTQIWEGNLPAYPWWENTGSQVVSQDIRADEVYTDGQYPLANIDHSMIGATFTHTLNARTFYEVSVQRVASRYRSDYPNLRDDSYVCPSSGIGPDGAQCVPGSFVKVFWTNNFGLQEEGFEDKTTCFGGESDLTGDGILQPYCIGTQPFGFAGTGGNLETGESTGGHWVKTRDTSDVRVYSGRVDLTSQLNRFLLMQTGAEIIYSDYDMHFAIVNLALIGPEPEQDFPWQRNPFQGAAYIQNKLEFQGFIANIGARLDYFNANTDWWRFDAFDEALRGRVEDLEEQLPKEPVNAQVALSPRIGVSFPITSNSKLYFNYGHFRQMLDPGSIFGIRQSKPGGIDEIGNPRHPMPKTVAYEIGFDQNLFDLFLLRISGFYRDIRDQPRLVTFNSLGNLVVYSTQMPWNYEDVRGIEFSLTKNRGQWLRGFANFTYLQRKEGDFGFSTFFENTFEMVNYLRDSQDYRQFAPVAEPFARMNLLFLSPREFGPKFLGVNPLGNWHVSLLGEWRAGTTFTWTGGETIPEVQNNVSWRDYWNFDLRFSRQLNSAGRSLQLFVDISNVFNIRNMHRSAGFISGCCRDVDDYMRSLHLDEDIFDQLSDQENLPYLWVPGDDTPGDFRKPGVAFQPIEAVGTLPAEPPSDGERAWYWAQDSGSYSRWNGMAWEAVPEDDLRQARRDKAYIDMPNLRFNTFLNPRMISLGIRVTL